MVLVPPSQKKLREAKYPEKETRVHGFEHNRHIDQFSLIFYLPKQNIDILKTIEILDQISAWLLTSTKASPGASKVFGEKLSNDHSTVDPLPSTSADKIKLLNLAFTQIYNADQSVLYLKMKRPT